MQIPTKDIIGPPVLVLIIAGAAIGAWSSLSYLYPVSSSMPYSKHCSSNKSIEVNVTSFQVRFVYTGPSKDYLTLISQTPNSHFQSSLQSCPLYFVDAVIVSGVNGSTHVYSNLSISPKEFVFANNGGFSGPQTANEIFPSFTIAYVGDTSYTGPLAIDVYSSS